MDCNRAAAVCRQLAPKPPRRAPGVEITMPLLVLGIAMALARQIWVGLVLCCAGFLYDYFAQQRAKRGKANREVAEVLALRGHAKLKQGLSGLAQLELNFAEEVLGPLEEGSTMKSLRRELRRNSEKRPKIAPHDVAKRTWRVVAADAVEVDAFLTQQYSEWRTKSKKLEDLPDPNDDKYELGYMDYCADGFQGM
mmetsp:Transcript_4834/g.11331  ORF Transcript_4834/g.11331 Transcript_4834/m.11331 type:complete len:195 (+) Transcript_4834:3-587(+)